MTPVALGPFDVYVHAPIGRGGMARVWSARHRATGTPVAVKVLDGPQAHDATFLQAFAGEVRAVAGLDHPGVVLVFDHGRIPEGPAAASGGALPAGSPYLVMEFAGAGTLLSCPPADGGGLIGVLLAILDALAHAHARGVVHRDIKGGNILLCGSGDLRPGWKVSDFGLAMPIEAEPSDDAFAGSAVGTPAYMAPEQFRGDVRDCGAWTDLYALGCLAWRLTTGEPPFGIGNTAMLADAHLHEPLPEFVPTVPLPAGFEGWLRGLLHKEPTRRFHCAADAARALWSLDTPEGAAARTDPTPTAAEPVGTATDLSAIGELEVIDDDEPATEVHSGLATLLLPTHGGALPRVQGVALRPGAPSRIPARWRTPEPPRSSLLGAGLGLLTLRRPPLVGRDAERDLLWTGLRRVFQEGRPRVVLLHGDRGLGKSRLAEWLCERADELGVAEAVRVTYGPTGGRFDGAAGMVVRRLGLAGLDPSWRRARVQRRLALQGVDDLREVEAVLALASDTGAATVGGRPMGPEERGAVLRRFLIREAADRPAVVWFDDVHRSPAAVRFCRGLADGDGGDRCPILALATADDEALRSDGATGEGLRGLAEVADDVPVGPLDEAAQRDLLASLLGLSATLSGEIRRRAEGNPLFAVQLVGDLAERGDLLSTPAGFTTADDRRPSLPRTVHALWQARLERALGGLRAGAAAAVEVAAALGERVDRAEWIASCAAAGVVAAGVEEALLEVGLARADDDGWAFGHGLLRASVEREARRAGRWADWNRACAAVLRPTAQAGPELRRLGLHLLEAEEWDAATEPLIAAAVTLWKGDDARAGATLLDRATEALDRLEAGPLDPRRLRVDAVRASVLLEIGRVPQAEAAAVDALARSRQAGEVQPEGVALMTLGRLHLRNYRAREAKDLLEPALLRFLHTDDTDSRGLALRLLARSHAHLKQYDDAFDYGRRALELAERLGDDSAGGQALAVLATVHRHQGRHDESEVLLRQAVDRFERAGHQSLLADCYAALGEAHRSRGRLADAIEWFGKAEATWSRVGNSHDLMGALCIAGAMIEGGDYEQALPRIERVRARLGPARPGYLSGAAAIIELQARAELGQWRRLAPLLEELHGLARQNRLGNPEFLEVIDRAAELARAARHLAIADGLDQLASTLRGA